MSAAYKCDRCKAVREGLSQNNRERVIAKFSGGRLEDLCEKCVADFESWYISGMVSK